MRPTHYYHKYLKTNPDYAQRLTEMITAGLPGAQEGFDLADFRAAVARYRDMTVDCLRQKHRLFPRPGRTRGPGSGGASLLPCG